MMRLLELSIVLTMHQPVSKLIELLRRARALPRLLAGLAIVGTGLRRRRPIAARRERRAGDRDTNKECATNVSVWHCASAIGLDLLEPREQRLLLLRAALLLDQRVGRALINTRFVQR